MQLLSEVEKYSLVVNNFVLPPVNYNFFESVIHFTSHVRTMQLSVVPECFKQADDFLYVESV